MNKSMAIGLWCIVVVVAVCGAIYCGDKLGLLGEPAPSAGDRIADAIEPFFATLQGAFDGDAETAGVEEPRQATFILDGLSEDEQGLLAHGYLTSGPFLASVDGHERLADAKELRRALREDERTFFRARSLRGVGGMVTVDVHGCADGDEALALAQVAFDAIVEEIEGSRRLRLEHTLEDLTASREDLDTQVNRLADAISSSAGMASQGDIVRWNTLIEALTLRQLELTDQIRTTEMAYKSVVDAREAGDYDRSPTLQAAFAADPRLQGLTEALTYGPADADDADREDRMAALDQEIQALRETLIHEEEVRLRVTLQETMVALEMVANELEMAIRECRMLAAKAVQNDLRRSRVERLQLRSEEIAEEISDVRLAVYRSDVIVRISPSPAR